jgi:acyl-phosphate glycerol 3-phosphate acyltransferase
MTANNKKEEVKVFYFYTEIGLGILFLVTGYLLGSILFAWVVTKLITGKDIRTIGNGNPGGRNVLENIGFGWGVLAGVLDILKVLGPLLIAYYIFHLETIFLFSIAVGTLLGHLYPLYFNFKGGKGAAVLIGSYLLFIPPVIAGAGIAVSLVSFFTKWASKFVSWIKPIRLSATRVVIVATIAALCLNYPGSIKLGIPFLSLLTFLEKETRQQVIIDPLIRLTSKK